VVRFYSFIRLAATFSATALVAGSSCGNLAVPAALPFNFHVVDDGRAYRSAQPDGEQLRAAAAVFGIRTVLNLRGSHPGEYWYDQQAAACEETGIALISIPLSAQSLPTAEDLAEVVTILQTAEYPMLIHCKSGADRTGLVSALYRMVVKGESREAALTELSPAYLQFRFYAPCMDTLAEMYEPGPYWLAWYAANLDSITCQP